MPPPTSSTGDPFEVLVQIRNLLGEMLGQTRHKAETESRKEAESELKRDKERAAELGEGTPVPDRPEHHKPGDSASSNRRGNRLGAEQDAARKRSEPVDSFDATVGFLGKMGMGEVAATLQQFKSAGEAFLELIQGKTAKVEQADPRPLTPAPEPRPAPPPLAEPGLTPVPHALPTVEQAEPLPDLPAPLTPSGHDPRKDALPDLPAPLTPDAPPSRLPDWLDTDAVPPPTIPVPPTPQPGAADERQSQRRETTLADGSRPTMLVPQPGQGTTTLATQDEDEDVAIGQTAPMLTPGPTPASAQPGSQQQGDQQRLAIALEKILALLQREGGGPTGDNDEDETEQGENLEPRSMWEPKDDDHAAERKKDDDIPWWQAAPPHPSTQQEKKNDDGANAGQLVQLVQLIGRFAGS